MGRRGMLPSYQGDSSSGGLLILLVGAYLLLAFVTGRLGWLTNTISDVFTAYNGQAPATPPPGVPPATATAYTPNRARPRTAFPGTQAYA